MAGEVNTGKFKRKLGLLDLTFIGLGSIIGSGWLFASQISASIAGPAAWIAWVIGAIAVYLLALVFAELGAAIPRAGGLVRYPDYSHDPLVGYLIGFMSLIAYSSVAGLEAEGVRTYASAWWPALGSGNPTFLGWFVQAILLIILFLLNYWSVNVFGKANSIVTFVKFFVPTLTIIVLLTQLHPGNFTSHGFAPFGFSGIETAVSTAGIVFAFQGFQQPVAFAAESKNPSRNIPLSILLALIVSLILYVLLQITFVGAVPSKLLTSGWGSLSLKSPFAGLATLLGMGWLANVILADAVLSPSGTGNVYLAATSRLFYAWAKNGTFFKAFLNVDSRTGIPRVALWLSLFLGIFWTLPFPSWDKLVSVVSSAGVLGFLMGPVAVAAFRRTAPGLNRPFRLKGLSVIGPLSFVVASLIVYWTGWKTDVWLLGAQVVMFVLYLVFQSKAPVSRVSIAQQIKSTWWLMFYYVVMAVLSYTGTFQGKGLISGPWDQIVVAVVSLVAYYWGAHSAVPNPVFYDAVEETDEDKAMYLGNKTTDSLVGLRGD